MRAPYESQNGDAVMEAIVKARNGSVLGKGSILKMYFFPGQRTSSNIQIHGAPHVYKVGLLACINISKSIYGVHIWVIYIFPDMELSILHLSSMVECG